MLSLLRSVTAHPPRLAAVLLASVALPSWGRAETWLPLETFVEFSPLVVKCQIERDDRGLRYRVLETWKGIYSPDRFAVSPSDGYFRPNHWPVHNPTEGQEIILFFNDNPYGSMLRGDVSSFPVTDGKVVYASTDLFGGVRYTVEGFKRAVIAYADPDARGAVFGGAAAWWLRVSAQGEGQSLLAERLRYATLIAPALSQESSPVSGADNPEAGDRNRTVAIVSVVATSVLVFLLVYRSLHRYMLRRV